MPLWFCRPTPWSFPLSGNFGAVCRWRNSRRRFGRGSGEGSGGGGTNSAAAAPGRRSGSTGGRSLASSPPPPRPPPSLSSSPSLTSSGSSPSSSESLPWSLCASAATSPRTRPNRGAPEPTEKPWKCGLPDSPVSKRAMHRYGCACELGSKAGITTRMESSVRRAIIKVARSGAALTKSKRTSLVLSSKSPTAARPSSERTFSR